MATSSDTLSAAGSLTLGCNGENRATFAVSGTYTGLQAVIEGTLKGSVWQPIAALRASDRQWESGTLEPGASVSRSWSVDVADYIQVRFRVTAISTGSVLVEGATSKQPDALRGGLYPTDNEISTGAEIKNTAGAGTPNGTGVTASERGDGVMHKTVLTFSNVAIALTDEAGAIAYGGLKVYDFPAGAILWHGATADLAIVKSSAGVNDDFDGDFSLGTVTASNNNTLSSTEANLIPSTATPQASSGATTATGQTTTALSGVIFDGTATAIDAYLNLLVDDADHDVTNTAANLLVTGTVTLFWSNLGDY